MNRTIAALLLVALPVLAPRTAQAEGLVRIKEDDYFLTEQSGGDRERALGLLDRALPTRSIAHVAADANREGSRKRYVTGVSPFILGPAFGWNAGDATTHDWYPQGITGAIAGDKKLVLVSWYNKGDKGVRISFVDVTDMDKVRYRHVLLVEPYMNGSRPDMKAVRIHAGGIALVGRWLYVVDTSKGFRVFDTWRMLEVTTGDEDKIGRDSSGRYHAHNYKYVLPQLSAYTLGAGSKAAVFSSVAIDRSTNPPSLVTCEYRKSSEGGLLFRWSLDERTGELAGRVRSRIEPLEGFSAPHTRIQGATSWKGQWYLSCSSQLGSVGKLYITGLGKKARDRLWSTGPESLHRSSSGNLWSLAEHPGARSVFAVEMKDID